VLDSLEGRDDALRLLSTGGIDPASRPETLDVEDFVNLSNAVYQKLA